MVDVVEIAVVITKNSKPFILWHTYSNLMILNLMNIGMEIYSRHTY